MLRRTPSIYILLSIKTRIETLVQGTMFGIEVKIYILLSIKTRIETYPVSTNDVIQRLFISYYPLKQGLKHSIFRTDQGNYSNLYPTIH